VDGVENGATSDGVADVPPGDGSAGACANVVQTIAMANSKPNMAKGVPNERFMIGSP
jgi:hypothetical protein